MSEEREINEKLNDTVKSMATRARMSEENECLRQTKEGKQGNNRKGKGKDKEDAVRRLNGELKGRAPFMKL